MIIAGGSYHEECQFPHESDFFGPGLRASAVTQNIVPSRNQLHTCIAGGDEEALKTYAATFEFDPNIFDIPETVTFDYLHNHSSPRIIPGEATNYQASLTGITGDAVLRFGLVEGTATVSGKRVVYDPQGDDPASFYANGSTADKLALVLNEQEAIQLSGERDIESIGSELLKGNVGADVVVIKRGAKGAIVRTPNKTSRIPVFQTESVWGIGSGDVFTGVFAAEWAEREKPAADAALAASKATAYYCQHRHLPVPQDLSGTRISSASTHFIPPNATQPTIYLAGPFFDIGERYVIEEVKHILESESVNVVSPVHDIGRATDYSSPEEVAQKDLEAIERADLVFTLLDHPDSGTHFELGYARKAGKPVIGYAHSSERRDDTMITGAGCDVYGDLASAIYNAVWRAHA